MTDPTLKNHKNPRGGKTGHLFTGHPCLGGDKRQNSGVGAPQESVGRVIKKK